jgi:hypothetical protein
MDLNPGIDLYSIVKNVTFDEPAVLDFINEIRANQQWPYRINDTHFWFHEIVGNTCICSYDVSEQRYFFKIYIGLCNGDKTIRVSKPSLDEAEVRAKWEFFDHCLVSEIQELLISYFPLLEIKEPCKE